MFLWVIPRVSQSHCLLSWCDTSRALSPPFWSVLWFIRQQRHFMSSTPWGPGSSAPAESQMWHVSLPANKDHCKKKRRWILTRFLRGGTFSFHLCRNVWSLDKMWLIKVQHHLRGSTLPLPPSSSTTGIKLRITVSSHTEWFVKILSYSVYYTVYTIYMMSITFIHWIIKRDLSKVLFLMSDRKSQIPASKLYKAQLWASETLINETPGVNKPRTDLCFFCCIP